MMGPRVRGYAGTRWAQSVPQRSAAHPRTLAPAHPGVEVANV
jgi:hypothetical protein